MTMMSSDVDDDGDSNENDANDKDGSNGDSNDGEVEHDGGDDNDKDNDDNDDDNVNVDIIEDNIDNGTMLMRWRWVASNKQNACKHCTTHPGQQSTYVNSLGRSRREIGTIFFGGDDRKGSRWRRLSGDHFISTQSIPNLPSGHPSAEKGPELIPHVSWE